MAASDVVIRQYGEAACVARFKLQAAKSGEWKCHLLK